MNLTLGFVMLLGLLTSRSNGWATFKDNAYQDIVVAIHPDIQQEGNEMLIDEIKFLMEDLSDGLFRATKGLAHIGSVKILLPTTWSYDQLEPVVGESFESAEFRIDVANAIHQNEPYTVQAPMCGNPGDHIHITPDFIKEGSKHKNRAKNLVQQFSKLRWGVFEEHGYLGDVMYPFFQKDHYLTKPNVCTNQDFVYDKKNIKTGNECDEASNPEDCTVEYDTEQPDITSSIMGYSNLAHNHEFCNDGDEEGESVQHLHKVSLKNKQNTFCDQRSTWSIIKKSADFLSNVKPIHDPDHDTVPKFVVVGGNYVQPVSYVLVLDVSGSMSYANRITKIKDAAKRWIKFNLPDGSRVGILPFNSRPQLSSLGLQITDATERSKQTMIDKVDALRAGGGTCITDALIAAADMFSNTENEIKMILLFTDGEQNYGCPKSFEDTKKKLQDEIRVISVAIGKKADPRIEETAEETGGKQFFVDDLSGPGDFNDAFMGANVAQPTEKSFDKYVTLYDQEWMSAEDGNTIEDSFEIDRTIGMGFHIRTDINVVGDCSAMLTVKYCEVGQSKCTEEGKETFRCSADNFGTFIYNMDDIVMAGSWKYSLYVDRYSSMSVRMLSRPRNDGEPAIKVSCSIKYGKSIDDSKPKMFIVGEVSRGNRPIINAEVTATVTRQSEYGQKSVEKLKLLDSGTGADFQKNDGRYSKFYTNYKSEGRYSVKCQVSGNGNTMEIENPSEEDFISEKLRSKRSASTRVRIPMCCGSDTVSSRTKFNSTGNFTRTTSEAGSFQLLKASVSQEDVFPPMATMDLKVSTECADNQMSFTSPGDDLDSEDEVLRYIFKFSKDSEHLTQKTFTPGAALDLTADYLLPGSSLQPRKGLTTVNIKLNPAKFYAGETYYIRMKSEDKAGNLSPLSNIVDYTCGDLYSVDMAVQDISENSATVSLTEATLYYAGSCDVELTCKPEHHRITGKGIKQYKTNVAVAHPILLDNLEPYTKYICTWKLVKCDGHVEQKSHEALVFTTEDGQPSEPVNVKVSDVTSRQVTVSWSPPINPRGVVQAYKVMLESDCSLYKQSKTVCGNEESSSTACEESDSLLLGNVTSHTFNVAPGTKYRVSVSAKTRCPREGSVSSPVKVTSQGEAPAKTEIQTIQSTGDDSVLIKLSPSCPVSGNTNYDVVWTCADCNRPVHTLVTRKISELEFETSNLEGGVHYQVEGKSVVTNCDVKTSNDKNQIEYENGQANCFEVSEKKEVKKRCDFKCKDTFCINRGLSVECDWKHDCSDQSDEINCTWFVGLTAHTITEQSAAVKLKESTGLYEGSCKVSLTCEHEQNGGDVKYFTRLIKVGESTHLRGLEPFTRYSCEWQLSACNRNVTADTTDPIQFTTLDGKPSEPTNLQFDEVTSSEMTIRWSPPAMPRGLIQSYKIIIESECDLLEESNEVCGTNYFECEEKEEIEVSNINFYKHKVVAGTKYSASILARTRYSEAGPLSKKQSIKTQGSWPNKPEITKITKDSTTGGALVQFSPSCPLTGETAYGIVWTCDDCSWPVEDLEITRNSDSSFQTSGLEGGVTYQVVIQTIVDNCDVKSGNFSTLSQEDVIQNRCIENSEPHSVFLRCDFKCKDTYCINSDEDIECTWAPECDDDSDEWNCTWNIGVSVDKVTENSATISLTEETKLYDGTCDVDITCKPANFSTTQKGLKSYQKTLNMTTMSVLQHLESFTRYTCEWSLVQCSRNVSKSTREPLQFTTLDGIPTEPTDLKVISVSSTQLVFNWSEPAFPRGIIQQYKIFIESDCEMNKETQRVCGNKKPSAPECNKHEVVQVGNVNTYTHTVSPGTEYKISLLGKTRHVADGPTCSPVNITSQGSHPNKPKITRVVEETITGSTLVEFSPPCPVTGDTEYEIVWTCTDCNWPIEELNSTQVSERYFETYGLEGGVHYQVQVKAIVTDCDTKSSSSDYSLLTDTEINQNECYNISEPWPVLLRCDFKCNDTYCVNSDDSIECNWVPECSDKSDEWSCTCTGFSCQNGFCIQNSQKCDGVMDCNDMSDETGCPPCTEEQFRCDRSGMCIDKVQMCDKRLDCSDGSDEQNCLYRATICSLDQFKCTSGKCIDQNKRCDRKPDCDQGEDEQGCETQCMVGEFTCQDGTCVDLHGLCDGKSDCEDGSDEIENCHCYKINEFACKDGTCLTPYKVCDGSIDCPDRSDETVHQCLPILLESEIQEIDTDEVMESMDKEKEGSLFDMANFRHQIAAFRDDERYLVRAKSVHRQSQNNEKNSTVSSSNVVLEDGGYPDYPYKDMHP